ncbi:U6 snRNA-associated Sm-like protein LSm4 isoform X1 [Peromyscus maniculatus bairdii]|uniref:U6 snRNA-associated Sm-like protein LSm4 isoform X1 n=1 Tax=Peromyscus maniculatus bairdii TaxID=230844 RepID=UPI001C2E3434|nr:U6 snRNA-associated Sm-like protein LSm4 isoform X1 [Peromyscus maniculatus bairdii]
MGTLCFREVGGAGPPGAPRAEFVCDRVGRGRPVSARPGVLLPLGTQPAPLPRPGPPRPRGSTLPLSLLKTAQNHPMLVELKNGETYNGHLVSCDNWMNINLREVICTSRDGDKFWRMPECYIRGSTIKYLRIPDEIIDMVREEAAKGRGRGGPQQQKQQKGRGMGGAGRGVFGGRGRGGIPGAGRGQPEKKPGRQAGKQ